ncbi:carboxymuconolactone decarboxylase family protein [Herbidospora sp. NEAU-GS84]|uniref:Carboxymuconolactone decarboxylase family protein n=1 Tax=Herbidospora solisilvae TaxID=2696284 RepID=A0A7C9J5W5_9ACTN|nr:carboxymuconolactone decarboxylase family protein [Herbidospora solisilvae]NAS25446.1 carboxymuconolactone decarboxylase family protein [Herbidospora solisilvae]
MRIDVAALAPEAYKAMLGLERYLRSSGLPSQVVELVKLRASQINGCAYCVHMHSADMKKAGEPDERIWGVAAWRETPSFTPAERAALALTEEATRLADSAGVGDEVWGEAVKYFDDAQLAALVVCISTINAWNRIAVTTHKEPEA